MGDAVAVLTDSDGFECEEASVGGDPAGGKKQPVGRRFRSIYLPDENIFIVELPISFFEVSLCDFEHYLPFRFGPNVSIAHFGNRPFRGNDRKISPRRHEDHEVKNKER